MCWPHSSGCLNLKCVDWVNERRVGMQGHLLKTSRHRVQINFMPTYTAIQSCFKGKWIQSLTLTMKSIGQKPHCTDESSCNNWYIVCWQDMHQNCSSNVSTWSALTESCDVECQRLWTLERRVGMQGSNVWQSKEPSSEISSISFDCHSSYKACQQGGVKPKLHCYFEADNEVKWARNTLNRVCK